jgi:hypothetical protein
LTIQPDRQFDEEMVTTGQLLWRVSLDDVVRLGQDINNLTLFARWSTSLEQVVNFPEHAP